MHVALQSTSRCFEAALALRTQGYGGAYAMDKRTKVQSEQREGKGEEGCCLCMLRIMESYGAVGPGDIKTNTVTQPWRSL